MDREARIKLIAEGASQAKKDVNSVGDALKEVGKAAFRAASDAARAMNDVKPIDFGRSAENAKKFDDTVTRLAIRSNRDIGQLSRSFRETGKEIGVLPDRVANVARSLTKLTGSNEAAEAMRDLGIEANDTDRTLEDMAEVGAELYNKLNVPLSRVGDALRTVRSTAEQFATTGGHLALEQSLIRLAPLLAKFSGGVRQGSALLAVLGKGKSPEVAQEVAGTVLGAFAGQNPRLIQKTMRQIMHDPKYDAYETGPDGRQQVKSEAMVKLLQYLKKRPYGAVLEFVGGDVTAADAIRHMRPEAVTDEVARLELEADVRALDAEKTQPQQQHRPGRTSAPGLGEVLRGMRAPGVLDSKFKQTKAGTRARVDTERADVELGVGEFFRDRQDERNAAYEGRRGTQALVDTAKGYLPSVIERAADIGEAGIIQAIKPGTPTPRVQVDLSPQSVKALGDQMRQNPPQIKPPTSPAAAATEANKALNRAAANF